MIMAAIWLLGLSAFDRRTALVGNGIALVFLAITTVLLVADLERPERFLRILTRPQWKSWLTRGAFILIGFSLVCTAWFAVELGAQLGWVPEGVAEAARVPLMLLGFPLALLTAIYTAFLFHQCEGRDLLQSRLMPWHMGVQAVMAGGAVWAALAGLTGQVMYVGMVTVPLVVASLADLLLRIAEVSLSHQSANGRQAAWLVRHGRLQAIWKRSLVLSALAGTLMLVLFASILAWLTGVVVIAADESDAIFSDAASSSMETLITTVIIVTPWVTTSAAILTLIGLFLYESAIIKAGQDVPNA
ncbi:MAG: polysulfide reductase NrfD [Ardenticatenia bacterium]|nr:polysulfide reductase NrfD [Ardenticatenia bacterium]